jgi:acyl-[acyl-carrier-protein] desaturase
MSEIVPRTDQQLLAELEPVASKLFERHLDTAKEWFPHEMVPWSRGQDFAPGYEWDESAPPLSAPVRNALIVNLLTEDNLPHYNRLLSNSFGNDGIWGQWNRRWTAEEGRHSTVIRDYLSVTRSVDLKELERLRMIQVSNGVVPQPHGIAGGIVYVALQELATRIAHRNTGELLDDPAGTAIMRRVAADENLHHLFYRDLASAALEIDPSGTVIAIGRQVRKFAMPGTGIPDFETRAKQIAAVGIYGFTEFKEGVLEPVINKHWKVQNLAGTLSDEAEIALEELDSYIEKLGRTVVAREQSARAQTGAKNRAKTT